MYKIEDAADPLPTLPHPDAIVAFLLIACIIDGVYRERREQAAIKVGASVYA